MNAIARLVMLGCLVFGGAVHAQSLNMLATSPISRFNATDNKLFRAAIDKALAEGSDGAPVAWKNEATPAEGVVTPQRSFVANGMKCRELLIANSYRTLRGEAVHTFCQTSNGKWKLQQ
jgi:surface antigen